ncbi:hypothetical protein L1D32_03695 [Shewanella insulae]|nr:hypothetical protein [Shewanella insulae]
MTRKPDSTTAMLQLIDQVRQAMPLNEPETFVCGPKGSCIGCPKKLLELVDTEIGYWESAIEQGETPLLGEVSRFAKLCRNVHRGLARSGILERYQTKQAGESDTDSA